MLWVEDIWAPIHSSDELAQKMRPNFDRMTAVLEAGLGTTKDYRAADVAAHLGWLNLLKAKILGEQGKIEELIEHALQMDPDNVYANAMMGDWVLETNGPLEKAKTNFATALKTGKAKAFVRGCQLQSMIYKDAPGVRAELIRTVNEMREDGETLGDGNRSRVHSYYSTTIGEDKDLRDVVSALPPDKAWATYKWVSPRETDDAFNSQEARFIQANIDEVAGNKAEALAIYRQLVNETKEFAGAPGSALARRREAPGALKSRSWNACGIPAPAIGIRKSFL